MIDTADRHPLREARAPAMTEPAAVTSSFTISGPARCPYRARFDACTFAGGCRSQLRDGGGRPLCAGAPLGPARVR